MKPEWPFKAEHKEDVAAASAAVLFNVLPELMKLPAPERYARLVGHQLGCLAAYDDLREATHPLPHPSLN